MTHDHPPGIEKLNEMRLLGSLKAISEHLKAHGVEKWADWFRGDFDDYLAARGQPNETQRQLAVIMHVLMAFGGMSEFSSLALTNENGEMLTEENEKLRELASQLWAGARGMQTALMNK
jgi:hypothetical protein